MILTAKEEKIVSDQNEIIQRFSTYCQFMGKNPMEMIKSEEGQMLFQQVGKSILEEKVLNFIGEKSN